MKLWMVFFLLAGSLGAQTFYEEHFAGGQSSLEWLSTWGEDADQVQVDWISDNPSGDGFTGKMGNNLSGGGVGTCIVDAPELTDYTVEAWVQMELATSHYRGVVGRVNDLSIDTLSGSWEFYAFVADLSVGSGMGDERFLFRRWVPGGNMINIREWSSTEMGDLYPTEDGWYKLAMSFEGDETTCYINDQEMPGGPVLDNTGLDPIAGGGFGVYYFHFMDYDNFLFFDDVMAYGSTGVNAPLGQASSFVLGSPYPNPFNPAVSIPFALLQGSRVHMEILDMRGATVKVLQSGQLAAGQHLYSWDGRTSSGGAAASGSYLLDLSTDDVRETRRITLLR